MHSAIIDKLAATTSLGLWPTIGLLWLSWVVYRFVLAYQNAAVSIRLRRLSESRLWLS